MGSHPGTVDVTFARNAIVSESKLDLSLQVPSTLGGRPKLWLESGCSLERVLFSKKLPGRPGVAGQGPS